jgi:ribosomal-protein-alanine N-acetyltransferase
MDSMPNLQTARLILTPLSRAMAEGRMAADDFSLHVIPIGVVHFPPSWPGDALGMFPRFLEGGEDPIPGTWVAIDRGTLTVVGQLGEKGDPDPSEVQEIGYGFGVQSRGFATEAVDALATHLLTFRKGVSAHTELDNVASQRVLQKSGFVQVGTAWEAGHGEVLVWQRRRP